MNGNISAIRKNYAQHSLLETEAAPDPVVQFAKWWEEALLAEIEEVNAMTLATASADGVPSARIVLLKDFSQEGFTFFTNYNSFKGRQLEENPKGCLVFFWKELERQVRITGLVEKVPAAESDAYFQSRPEESRIGAISSPQSQVIESREWLHERFHLNQQQLAGTVIERPGHWGGYRLKPVMIEFWQGRPGRLHDRLHYSLDENGNWKRERLAP